MDQDDERPTGPTFDNHPENASLRDGSAPTEAAFDFEAQLLELSRKEDPWEYLAYVRDKIDSKDRYRAYEHFLLLVAGRPAIEKDSLGSSGRDIFKYRMETFRADLQRLEASAGDSIKVVPTVAVGGVLAELVYRPGEPSPIQFCVYREGVVEFADRLKIGKTTFIPPMSKLVELGTILVPSGAEDYGSDHDLFIDIRSFLSTYLYIDNAPFRNILSYYVLLSWVYDCFRVVPYIRARGDYGSGKTRLLEAMGVLVYRGIFAGGATTPSPLFRILEMYHGSLVLDEADFEVSEAYSEIIKILNQGYQKNFSVLRSEKTDDGFDVRAYNTFGPKIIATRMEFKDKALESRCLSHVMGPVLLPEHINLVLDDEFYDKARSIRNKLLMWRFKNYGSIKLDPSLRFPHFEPRMNQIVQPLLSCTQDQRMRDEILTVVEHYQARMIEERRDSKVGQIAVAIAKLYWKNRGAEFLLLKNIVEQVNVDNETKYDSKSLADTIRGTLNISVKNRGGVTKVFVRPSDIERLYHGYTLQHVVPRPDDYVKVP